jgi:hypothetical protein
MIGFILNIIASILKTALQPFCFVYGTIRALQRKEFNTWQKTLAYTKDVWGNSLIKYIADDVLITKKSKFKFGHKKQTISYVLGANKLHNTLTIFGKLLSNILNFIDPNHVEKAYANYNRTSL